MEHIIKEVMQKIWIFKEWLEIQEIRESTNNKVYAYDKYIIKISEKASNLKNECEILRRLENKWKFPKIIHCEIIIDYADWNIWKKSFSFDEYKKWEMYHETWVIKQKPVWVNIDDAKKNELVVLIMEKLPWNTLSQEWNKLNLDEKWKLIDEIINNIKTVHSLKSNHEKYKIAIQKTAKENYIKNKDNPHVPFKEIEDLYYNFLINLGKFIDSDEECVIHNDLWYKNILVENKKLSWIVDFETAVYWPIQLELFRLIQHKFFAQNDIDSWSQDYTEIWFIDMLFERLKLNYRELFIFNNEQLYCYNVNTYLRLLSKYNESWFNYEEVKKFKSIFLDWALQKCPIC